MITIYTNPGCGPCRSLIKAADRLNITYTIKPAADHTTCLEELGHTHKPPWSLPKPESTFPDFAPTSYGK